MEYYMLYDLLYAYDTDTGFLLKFSDGKWALADYNIITLTHEPWTQKITESEARLITKADPREVVKKFFDRLSD